MGLPQMSFRGFPGSLVEEYLAGMIPIIFMSASPEASLFIKH
jgi:hypothetical protein